MRATRTDLTLYRMEPTLEMDRARLDDFVLMELHLLNSARPEHTATLLVSQRRLLTGIEKFKRWIVSSC